MFIMGTVSELMLDSEFCEALDKSDICEVPWKSNGTNRELSGPSFATFQALLNHCIEYHKCIASAPPPLDTGKISDCVRFACAAYSHKGQKDIMVICVTNY